MGIRESGRGIFIPDNEIVLLQHPERVNEILGGISS